MIFHFPRTIPDVLYVATTSSLAHLEMLVHLNQSALMMHYVIFKIEIPGELIDEYSMAQLPENWTEYPSPVETAEIGDAPSIFQAHRDLKPPLGGFFVPQIPHQIHASDCFWRACFSVFS